MYRWKLAKACLTVGMTILILFSTLFIEQQAHAWSCSYLSVTEKLERADYVFKGRVVEYGEEKQGYPGYLTEHTFEVYESWKGVSDTQFTFWSFGTLKMDTTYLVYASMNSSGDIISGFCNGSSKGAMMKREIRIIGEGTFIQEEIPEPRFVWSDQKVYTKISTVFVAIFLAIWITLRVRKMMTKTKE